MYQKVKPYAAMVFQQFSFAVLSIIFLATVKDEMTSVIVYRNIVAAIFIAPFALYFERAKKPMMTRLIFIKIMALALFQAVLEQNLYFLGTKLTSATYGAALKNLIPSITFFLSLVLRVEKLNIHQLHGKAKVTGALLTLIGALIMVLYEGQIEEFPWSKERERHSTTTYSDGNDKDSLRRITGTIMILASSTSWSIFLILQSNTLKSYEAKLSLTTLICCMGAIMNIVLALILGHGRPQFWIISWDMRLIAIIYSGVVCTAFTNYLLEMVLKDKGPVFAGAFSPLCMIITAILGSFILVEKIHLGTILGAIFIVAGVYSLLWGKHKDQLAQSGDNQGWEYLEKSNISIVEPVVVEQSSITIDHDTKEEKVIHHDTKEEKVIHHRSPYGRQEGQ